MYRHMSCKAFLLFYGALKDNINRDNDGLKAQHNIAQGKRSDTLGKCALLDCAP